MKLFLECHRLDKDGKVLLEPLYKRTDTLYPYEVCAGLTCKSFKINVCRRKLTEEDRTVIVDGIDGVFSYVIPEEKYGRTHKYFIKINDGETVILLSNNDEDSLHNCTEEEFIKKIDVLTVTTNF